MSISVVRAGAESPLDWSSLKIAEYAAASDEFDPATAKLVAFVVTKCTLGHGYAFYAPGLIEGKVGWSEDGFSSDNGQLTLLQTESGFDLILTDAISTRSVRDDGGRIVAVPGDIPNSIAISVSYDRGPTLESYVFLLDPSGAGLVLWTSSRASIGMPKVGAYVGSCKK